ncbi:Type IV secretion system protein virB10 [compost metagenome]
MQNSDLTDDNRIGEADAALPDDKSRGVFDVRNKRANPRPVKIYVLVALVVVAFFSALAGIWAVSMSKINAGSSPVDESTVVADATLNGPVFQDDAMKQYKQEKLKKIEEEEQKRRDEEKARQELDAQNVVPVPNTPAPPVNRGGKSVPSAPPGTTAEQRKLGGGVMLQANDQDAASYASGSTGAGGAGRRPGAGSAAAPKAAESSSRGLGAAGDSSRGSLSDLSGPGFTPDKATLMPSRKYLLAHGTYARCALYPEIITEHPGIIDCRLTEPLYSADGSTVIAEAGDRMSGVQKVQMSAGQARVFTSWTELETASGTRAKLASLGAGPMGASGTAAWIDNHYMQRYGGAVMLSFIQDALQAASNSAQNNDSGYTVNNTEQNVQNMAEKALDSTINIPPTGYILPGTVITVIVARDIDFSSVFENHSGGGHAR